VGTVPNIFVNKKVQESPL